jgi:hypothetical protein
VWYEVAYGDEWQRRVGDLALIVHESQRGLEWIWSLEAQSICKADWHTIHGGSAETKQDAQAAAENAARDFAQAILAAL